MSELTINLIDVGVFAAAIIAAWIILNRLDKAGEDWLGGEPVTSSVAIAKGIVIAIVGGIMLLIMEAVKVI